jgi:hypothetical protein
MKKSKLLVALMAGVASASSFAAGPDLTPLTSVIEFDTVTVAVLSIAGLMAVVYVAVKGAKIGLAMLKGS